MSYFDLHLRPGMQVFYSVNSIEQSQDDFSLGGSSLHLDLNLALLKRCGSLSLSLSLSSKTRLRP